ncbi:uncharacterized protein LOC141618790 [Silene latifolia]|uniref:uncharacterized protein LOC141618790 n=1 Tax=Silene latifolia TaxID=37657 RepID=UPI003D77838D
MTAFSIHYLRRVARLSVSLVNSSPKDSFTPRLFSHSSSLICRTSTTILPSPSRPSFLYRNFSHGTVNLVISQGKPKFEVHEVDAPKKEKWQTKKRLKMQRMREKKIRKAANRRDPRRLTLKRKKQMCANVEERIKYKIEKARAKEVSLVERLKRYEVSKVEGPVVKPHELTGEERFYFKKMAQRGSNYVPVGRRGVFGGVILNMHLHWKKHETVKVFFKPCKPGQIQEYVRELERLSGGVAIQTIGDDTAVFYRGKNYVQPEVMSPIDTLSKKRALEKSKYEQSLETVRHFIAISEKELELYYRHIALYSNTYNQSVNTVDQNTRDDENDALNCHFAKSKHLESASDSDGISGLDYDSTDEELTGMESSSDLEQDDCCTSGVKNQDLEERKCFSGIQENL